MMALIILPGKLVSGYGSKRVSISPHKNHILYYVTGGSLGQCAASVISLFCSARWHDVVEGTIENYRNKGINTTDEPLVVRSIRVTHSFYE